MSLKTFPQLFTIRPYHSFNKKPNLLLEDIDSQTVKEIIFLWNFIQQQQNVIHIENTPEMDNDEEDTEEVSLERFDNKRKLNNDGSFKNIVIALFHSPYTNDGFVVKLISFLVYQYFNSTQKWEYEHQMQIIQNIPINKFTIPMIFYIITNKNEYLQCDEAKDINHKLFISQINELVRVFLDCPTGQMTAKKTPSSLYMRTRVLGVDKNGFQYFILNGFLLSCARGKWYVFHTTQQIDELFEKLGNNEKESDLYQQLLLFRKYIKSDRKVGHEFAVSKKGTTPITHYKTFVSSKPMPVYDEVMHTTIISSIKTVGWILSKLQRLVEFDIQGKFDEMIIRETMKHEKSIIEVDNKMEEEPIEKDEKEEENKNNENNEEIEEVVEEEDIEK